MKSIMRTTCKFTIYLSFSMFLSINGMAQFSGNNYDISGFTKVDDLKIVNDEDEVESQIEIGEAYSKARGATIFSPMNRINNRARRKLLEEASVRGASHVWVLHRTIEGGLGRFVSYHAVFYRDKELAINPGKVRNFLQDGNLKPVQITRSDRNGSGLKTEMILTQFKLDPNTIQVKNNRVFVDNVYLGGSEDKGVKNSFERTFEVIGIDEKFIIVAEEVQEGKTFEARVYEKVQK
jgi:hypothetical protein